MGIVTVLVKVLLSLIVLSPLLIVLTYTRLLSVNSTRYTVYLNCRQSSRKLHYMFSIMMMKL